MTTEHAFVIFCHTVDQFCCTYVLLARVFQVFPQRCFLMESWGVFFGPEWSKTWRGSLESVRKHSPEAVQKIKHVAS